MAHHDHSSENAYTMEQALADATQMLEKQYGKAEQPAAVQLATFLYGVHSRDEFLREHGDTTGTPYGSP